MYKRQILGKEGEDFATRYLEHKGYIIIEKNFRCKLGEIDIIALEKNEKYREIVFIEVKTREDISYGDPIEAVNESKQKHIIRAAKYYIYKHNLENEYIRFDVIEIIKVNGKYNISQIKNCNMIEKRKI